MKPLASFRILGAVTPGPWKQALAFENNAPNYYAVTNGKWGAPTIAKCYGTEADAVLIAAAPRHAGGVARIARRAARTIGGFSDCGSSVFYRVSMGATEYTAGNSRLLSASRL